MGVNLSGRLAGAVGPLLSPHTMPESPRRGTCWVARRQPELSRELVFSDIRFDDQLSKALRDA